MWSAAHCRIDFSHLSYAVKEHGMVASPSAYGFQLQSIAECDGKLATQFCQRFFLVGRASWTNVC
jgi:hypothetical protein